MIFVKWPDGASGGGGVRGEGKPSPLEKSNTPDKVGGLHSWMGLFDNPINQLLVSKQIHPKVAKPIVFMYFFSNVCRENSAKPKTVTSTL